MAIESTIAEIHVSEWGRLVAILARETRDLDAAEDLVQDAFARALVAWNESGLPDSPAAWLLTTARNLQRDTIRRRRSFDQRLPLLIDDAGQDSEELRADIAFGDDRLRLIFTCCHPALAIESRLALTLRLVCGLSTREIGALFLATESTIQARITRAKAKIANARIPYRIPAPADMPERLADVLAVIHLVYAGGHTAGDGYEVRNPAHVALATGLSRTMLGLMPDNAEVMGLLALILLTEARQSTRTDVDGLPTRLEDMDRSMWDRDAIHEGTQLLEHALRRTSLDSPGPYVLQAAIAAIHAEAPTFDDTDWPQIVAFYTVMQRVTPSPVIDIARAVAIGMAEGADAGLAVLEPARADERVARYDILHAARADLLRRAGRADQASDAYRLAAEHARNASIRLWYERQARAMDDQK